MNISDTDIFNVDAAKSFEATNATMVSAKPSVRSITPSSSSSSTRSMASSTSTTSSTSLTSSKASDTSSSTTQTPTSVVQASNRSKDGAIAGSIVGGVAGLALIAGAALAFWRRRRVRRVRRRYSSCTIDPSVVGPGQCSSFPKLRPSDSASQVYVRLDDARAFDAKRR
ncbi:hypothetical protein PsYK624_111340 [Phanerochaete sordida]|uniref:Uncharacterized protein n=1 Tax=Phanerochaete sordida TaxID=48140 RepID=A0A9P3GHD7_9APHY|nr:hypothetical protein PsYK624_111340 [Phanerochaete sordida]